MIMTIPPYSIRTLFKPRKIRQPLFHKRAHRLFSLGRMQALHKMPVIHGVFVFEKVKHARVRCLGQKHNRGTEAAQTALEMARVMRGL